MNECRLYSLPTSSRYYLQTLDPWQPDPQNDKSGFVCFVSPLHYRVAQQKPSRVVGNTEFPTSSLTRTRPAVSSATYNLHLRTSFEWSLWTSVRNNHSVPKLKSGHTDARPTAYSTQAPKNLRGFRSVPSISSLWRCGDSDVGLACVGGDMYSKTR